MKIAIYYRTSTTRQDLSVQKEKCRELAKNRGFEIVKEYEDFGFSGKNRTRPNFNLMLSDVFHGEIDAILIYSFSRISRNLRDLLNILYELQERKISLISIKEQIDSTTAAGRAMLSMTGMFYQFQREIQNELIKEKLATLKAKGKQLGRKPVKVDKKVLMHFHERGLTVRQIAAKMKISKSTVSNIVREVNSKSN